MVRVFLMLCALSTAVFGEEPALNWLSDPGAEALPPTSAGWQQVSGDWSQTKADAKPHSGTGLFWGGAAARSELVQEVSLQDIADVVIQGPAKAFLSGWLNSFKGDKDTSEILLEAVNGDGVVVAKTTTGPKNFDDWELVRLTLIIPKDAAVLRVHLISVRQSGNDNNGYFDDLDLAIMGPQRVIPVPNGTPPATAAVAGTAPSQTPPPRDTGLADRAAPVTMLQTTFGRARIDGTLETTDGIVNHTYADTWLYLAESGESLSVSLSAPEGQELVPLLSVMRPMGQPFQVSQAGNNGQFRLTVPASGLYTIRVSAADPSRLTGTYALEVTGRGQQVNGTLDPLVDLHDSGRILDTVAMRADSPGVYRLDLYAKDFHSPAVTVRGTDAKEVPSRPDSSAAGAAVSRTCVLAKGLYNVVVADDRGGDWRLDITYVGGPR